MLFMKKTTLRTSIIRWVCCFCIILILIFIGGVFQEDEIKADGEVIRIGYVPSDSFITEIEGEYFGYAVDYLDEIAMYTGWTYEYVPGTWDECLNRVMSGEVDFLCMIQYTEERAEKYLFSKQAMGDEYCLIYARNDEDIHYRDYANMDGCTIALLPNTVYDERLDDLEEQEDIKFERVYYDDVEQIMNALLSGQTELAVIGSLFGNTDAKVVGRDDGMPFYCVTNKQNEELMKQFDDAMHHVNLNDAGIESRLYQKYYAEDKISSTPLFTREEIEFIKSSDEVVVKLMTSTQPLCYKEDGEIKGIFVEYLKLFEKKTGLDIRIEETTSSRLNDLTQNQLNKTYLTLRSKRVVDYIGLEEGLISSSPIIETELAYVKRKEDAYNTSKDDYVFAITKEMEYYLPALIKRGSSKYQIKYYDTAADCMVAVLESEADIAVHDAHLISYLMQKPIYEDKLTQVSGMSVVNGMCLISSKGDEMLIGIFDKVIGYISEEEIQGIVDKELRNNPYNWNILDFAYRYWRWIAALLLIIIVSFVVYAMLMRRMANLKVQRKEYEMLQKRVQQDELTGVYNKKYFYEKAAEMIDNAQEEMCIVMMDITNFKVVNDLFGLESGDKLLRYMAQDLMGICEGREVIVSRFNADHYYMCMSVKDFKELYFPRKYKRTPIENMDIRVNYGVFMIGEQKDVPVNIMCDRASMAVHGADVKSDEYIFYYTEADRNRMVKQQEIEGDMEKALEQHEFCVYVQPKYDIYKRKIVGGEALARWIHPEKGMISPGDFIPVFEKNGFIRYLDYYIWEETCRLIAEIKEKKLGNYPVSINVSRAHFYTNELKKKLEELLQRYNLQPDDIELEITESIYVEDSDIINSRIQELRDMGFKIAMDDFGSGYSSLNMLKEIPLDIIKMDLKFLDSSENVEKSHKILDSLVDLAKRLDLYVVVEGVETEEQLEFLQGIGEMSAQGYYFSRPIDSAKYEELLVLEKIS